MSEVSYGPSGSIRLPNSVQKEAQRGADPYGSSDFAKSTPLDAKPAVKVGRAAIGGDYAFNGITKSASVTGAHGVVETTASNENLSKKFKYPQKSQDVPEDFIALDTMQSQN